jgi:hypothetical protein
MHGFCEKTTNLPVPLKYGIYYQAVSGLKGIFYTTDLVSCIMNVLDAGS